MNEKQKKAIRNFGFGIFIIIGLSLSGIGLGDVINTGDGDRGGIRFVQGLCSTLGTMILGAMIKVIINSYNLKKQKEENERHKNETEQLFKANGLIIPDVSKHVSKHSKNGLKGKEIDVPIKNGRKANGY